MCGHKPSPNIIVQLMFYCFEVFVVPLCVCELTVGRVIHVVGYFLFLTVLVKCYCRSC